MALFIFGFIVGFVGCGIIFIRKIKSNAFSEKIFDFSNGKYKVVKLDSKRSLDLLERVNVI